jgi:alkylation response protein AidB-like acyl-CoA dehydrogenase
MSAILTDRTDTVLERFTDVLEQIRKGAREREASRSLPYAEINQLKRAGFGTIRVPVEFGGLGAGIDELTEVLISLGAADSNIVQALRGHIGFVEYLLEHPDKQYRQHWLRRIGTGVIVGNAESERTGTFGELATTVTASKGKTVLNGTKYYTTGSIFADWINVTAAQVDDESGDRTLVALQVPTDTPGVEITDDWDGFGQRLTGSGTTVFTDVEVDPSFIWPKFDPNATGSVMNAVYQLTHLSALAGIAQAAQDEILEFLKSRTRNLTNPSVAPTDDPISLQVIGETYGTVNTVKAAVLEAARVTNQASVLNFEGVVTADDYALAEAHVYGVQSTVIDLVLRTIGRIFEVGGASAVSTSRGLDRLWRNARTVASHNPALQRQQIVGDYLVNGVLPGEPMRRMLTKTSPQ